MVPTTTGVGLRRSLGQAASTFHLTQAAKAICNAYRMQKELSKIEDSTREEFEADNLRNFFVGFIWFLARTPIPQFLNEAALPELLPRNITNKKYLMCSTLEKYLGQVKELMRRKFPDHDEFQGLRVGEDPPWWSSLLAGFTRECTRFHLTLNEDDVVFGDTHTRAIYRTNNNKPYVGDPRPNSLATHRHETLHETDHQGSWHSHNIVADVASQVDLKLILSTLMRRADPALSGKEFQKRCWVAFLFMGAGRGGEIKFLNFMDWMWHVYLQALNTSWTQPKTLDKFAMGFVADAQEYETDIFHAMGCFWAVERGLHRTPQQKKSGISNYLFPDLHSVTDGRDGRCSSVPASDH